MKLLSVLALVLFVGANSFAQTGAAGTQQAAPAASAPADTTVEHKMDKPMHKKEHKKKKAKKKAAAE